MEEASCGPGPSDSGGKTRLAEGQDLSTKRNQAHAAPEKQTALSSPGRRGFPSVLSRWAQERRLIFTPHPGSPSPLWDQAEPENHEAPRHPITQTQKFLASSKAKDFQESNALKPGTRPGPRVSTNPEASRSPEPGNLGILPLKALSSVTVIPLDEATSHTGPTAVRPRRGRHGSQPYPSRHRAISRTQSGSPPPDHSHPSPRARHHSYTNDY